MEIIQTKEKKVKENLFARIPNDIIENDILPFLNTKDLFFSVRGVSPEWSDYMRNIWCTKIKDEMVDQVRSIDLVYEKEVFAKTYEFKIKYLINYKNLLTLYIINTNICTVINNLNQNLSNDENIFKLLQLLFKFLQMDLASFYLENNENNNLFEYFSNTNNASEINDIILNLLKVDTYHIMDLIQLNGFKLLFNQLNKEYLENFSEQSKLIYSFLLGIIEYQILKIDIRDLKSRIEKLINSIQESARLWPRKRLFFERANNILLYTKNSYSDLHIIMKVFEKNKIRHPLIDFNDDSLKLIIHLKESLNDPNFDTSKLEETIFENILNRRVLLSKKIIILEKYLAIYRNSKVSENEINIRGKKFSLKEFLWTLKFSSNSEGENIDENVVIKTKNYLDDYFDFDKAIIYSCPHEKKNALLEDLDQEIDLDNYYNGGIEQERKNYSDELVIDHCIGEEFCNKELEDEINENEIKIQNTIEKKNKNRNLGKTSEYLEVTVKRPNKPEEKDLDVLKSQKEELTQQKEKTENVLQMLKKFLILKENVMNNKKKYRFVLYIISKIRKDNMENVSIESIQDLIKDLDIEQIMQNNDFNLTESEISGLENFDNTEKLLQDIEIQLFKHVDEVISKINN